MARPAIAAVLHFSFRMTIDAPWHFHRCNARYAVHCFDRTMTFLALETGLYMTLVREVNEVRDVVYLYPRYRLTIFPVGGQLEDLRTIANTGHRIVTSHAFADAGDAGNRRPICIDVTVLARNLVVRCMHCVTEFDGLDRTAVRKIFAVHPCAYEQSDHKHETEQGRLLCGSKRIEYGYRQMVPPSFRARVCP